MGMEDQGWVAWFMLASELGRPVTIFGDGKQVRDMLYVDDLVDAYLLAVDAIDRTSGRAYNIGGGPAFALSIWAEFAAAMREPAWSRRRWSSRLRGRATSACS